MTKFKPKKSQKYWCLVFNGSRFKPDNSSYTGDAEDRRRIKSGLIRATKKELIPIARDLNKLLHDFAKGKVMGKNRLDYQ